jgi:outer membrane protein assembly factor BamB
MTLGAIRTLLIASVCVVSAFAQATPKERFTVNLGFRDWGPTTIAGTTIVGGNSSNRGGLFAVDTVTGKMKWSARSVGLPGTFVATKPAVTGGVVIAPMGNTVVAFQLATGKEIWRGPKTEQGASVAADSGTVYVLAEDNNFYALDAATGRQKWKVAFVRGSGPCESVPVVRDGVVYVTGSVLLKAADAYQPASYYRHLFALDANTGNELWRYPAKPVGNSGICFTQPIVTADAFFAVAETTLYSLNLSSGRDRWTPIEVRRPVDGRERGVRVSGLVDAGPVLVGLTPGYLIAFDKSSGKTAWEIPGQYRESSPSTAVAGRVLYFQGHPGAPPPRRCRDGFFTLVESLLIRLRHCLRAN